MPTITLQPVLAGIYVGANAAVASPADVNKVAAPYKFRQMPIAMPPGYHATQAIRGVNPAYRRLVSWISSVGASIAMTGVTGH